MRKAMIQLAYKQTIDAASAGDFEKKVFDDSYSEYLMQVQAYVKGTDCTTFPEIMAHNPKAASLHYKVGFAIGLYVNELAQQIPQLHDTLGHTLPFITHKFEIITSDTMNKSAHQVAITYSTDRVLLLDSIGDYMLLAKNPQTDEDSGKPADTILLKTVPHLSIISYRETD